MPMYAYIWREPTQWPNPGDPTDGTTTGMTIIAFGPNQTEALQNAKTAIEVSDPDGGPVDPAVFATAMLETKPERHKIEPGLVIFAGAEQPRR